MDLIERDLKRLYGKMIKNNFVVLILFNMFALVTEFDSHILKLP